MRLRGERPCIIICNGNSRGAKLESLQSLQPQAQRTLGDGRWAVAASPQKSRAPSSKPAELLCKRPRSVWIRSLRLCCKYWDAYLEPVSRTINFLNFFCFLLCLRMRANALHDTTCRFCSSRHQLVSLLCAASKSNPIRDGVAIRVAFWGLRSPYRLRCADVFTIWQNVVPQIQPVRCQ